MHKYGFILLGGIVLSLLPNRVLFYALLIKNSVVNFTFHENNFAFVNCNVYNKFSIESQ